MDLHRPDWNEYFLGLAFIVSSRSRDKQTKHGTVIVDSNNIILGTGYNSFIRGVDDAILPDSRPNKYPYMIHSELNAIFNCRVLPREAGGGRAYVTGKCCNHCLQSLIQVGITEIFMANRQGTALEDEQSLSVNAKIIEQSKIKINVLDYNLNWINQIANHYNSNK
jgi:dCMP deaminase